MHPSLSYYAAHAKIRLNLDLLALEDMLGANLVLSRVASLEAAASGQPDKLRWVFLLVET
jgi:hypothetical protein